MTHGVVITLFSSGITLMVPILWAALGEVINETAGVLNIGIEGVMLFGAFVAAVVLHASHSFVLAGAAAIPTGLGAGLVLSYLYVTRGTDQIIGGIMFNLFALGLTTGLYEQFLTESGRVRAIGTIAIPGLSRIPGVGPVLFDQTVVVYGAIVAAVVVFYLLRRTWFGLYLRVVGERPRAGATAGLSVTRLRYVSLLIASVLVAFGGASIIITNSGNFLPDITSGQGFIALAVVVLGRFNPLWAVLGAALFGVSTALEFQAQNIGFTSHLASQFWIALPYVITIVAVVVAKRAQYPDAAGIPYQPAGVARRRAAGGRHDDARETEERQLTTAGETS